MIQIIFIGLFFLFNSINGIEERYYSSYNLFCSDHDQIPSNFKKFFPLIPHTSACHHTFCNKCQNTWIREFYEPGGKYEGIYWTCDCKEAYQPGIEFDAEMPSWYWCRNPAIYNGYFDPSFKRYFPCFESYLKYLSNQTTCNCYWPERSNKALEINNIAYNLFEDLFKNTALKVLHKNAKAQKNFLRADQDRVLHSYEFAINSVCHSFFYSDYELICKDIEIYSKMKFKLHDSAKIKDKLDNICATLAPMFIDLYKDCLNKHLNERIEKELFLIESRLNYDENWTLSDDELKFIPTNKSFIDIRGQNLPGSPSDPLQSNVYLQKGILFNDLLLYKEAIAFFNKAINLNPNNREAYIERAAAFFETNQINLAIEDFKKAKELAIIPPFLPGYAFSNKSKYLPERIIEFSQGLIGGIIEGSKVAVQEFMPSLLSSCRGLLSGLWAFVCSPSEVSQDIIEAAYGIGEFLNSHTTQECLEVLVPELQEMAVEWHTWHDYVKGQKIGFIIGKYGIDIYIPSKSVKVANDLRAINKYRSLKRANTLSTLECCASSEAKRIKILEESGKRAILRNEIIEATRNSKIIIRSSNVIPHVLQKKHGWNKLIKLTGDMEVDFKKIVVLLEENCITDSMNVHGLPKKFPSEKPKILRTDYIKVIKNQKVHAVFETFVETNETYLMNAWIIH